MERMFWAIFVIICLGIRAGSAVGAMENQTTNAPTTGAPTTGAPTTAAPTTAAPSTPGQTTPGQTTPGQTTPGQTTPGPTSANATKGATASAATGNGTEPMTTMTTGNSTESNLTQETTAQGTPFMTTPLPPAGRYEINGTNGTCILMELHLSVNITYNTTSGKMGWRNVTFPDDSIPSGNCSSDSRFFQLTFPSYDQWFVRLDFEADSGTYQMINTTFQWKYEKPFFDDAAEMDEKISTYEDDALALNVRADTGKTYQCKKQEILLGQAEVTLKSIKYQPYADMSEDKGDFGIVENCKDIAPTDGHTGTTVASTSNAGKIVGIVIGCIAGLALIIGGVFFFMRYRHHQDSYTSLD